MSDDDLENDELEVGDEDDTEEGLEAAGAEDVADDSGDDTPVPAAKGKKAAVSVDELPSIEAKNKERDALARAMEEFLSRGGKVQEVEPNVVADPPKKPDNKYGSRLSECLRPRKSPPSPRVFLWLALIPPIRHYPVVRGLAPERA
jgi:hypothetical protein